MKRPVTRKDCLNVPRPCPWVSCRHHLAIGGRNRLRGGWQDRPTCSLDLADEGPRGSRELGAILGISHQGVLNLEVLALAKARRILERAGLTFASLGLDIIEEASSRVGLSRGGKCAKSCSKKPAQP
jgi:hypothetical protein